MLTEIIIARMGFLVSIMAEKICVVFLVLSPGLTRYLVPC